MKRGTVMCILKSKSLEKITKIGGKVNYSWIVCLLTSYTNSIDLLNKLT